MKHTLDKTRLAESAQRFSLALIMFEISVWLDPLAAASETIRYIQQGSYAVTILLAVRAVLSLRRLIPKNVRRAIFDKFLYAMRKMASNIAGISKKVLSLFGFSFDRFKRGKDEKSFVFGEEDEEAKKKKRHSVKASSKWRDMEENSQKIRFLYVRYIVKLIKEGYKYHVSLTPNEVRENIGLDEEHEENEIFDLYNGARYSGGSIYITDEQVDRVMEVVNSKKKTKLKAE